MEETRDERNKKYKIKEMEEIRDGRNKRLKIKEMEATSREGEDSGKDRMQIKTGVIILKIF